MKDEPHSRRREFAVRQFVPETVRKNVVCRR